MTGSAERFCLLKSCIDVIKVCQIKTWSGAIIGVAYVLNRVAFPQNRED